jgi:hypothetical protein
MPNWCSNTVTISHPDPDRIAALVAGLKSDEPEFFQIIRPMPESVGDDWYNWRVAHWGTKWDISEFEIYDETPNSIHGYFETAWSPPVALYEFMVSEGYHIEAAYSEFGMGFRGTFSNDEGDFCEEYNPDEEEGEFE